MGGWDHDRRKGSSLGYMSLCPLPRGAGSNPSRDKKEEIESRTFSKKDHSKVCSYSRQISYQLNPPVSFPMKTNTLWNFTSSAPSTITKKTSDRRFIPHL